MNYDSPLLVPTESTGRRPRRRKDLGRLGSPSPVARRLSWTPPPQVLRQLNANTNQITHKITESTSLPTTAVMSNSESETVAEPDAVETDDMSARCSSSDTFINPPPRLEKGRIRRFIKKKSPNAKVLLASPATSQDTNNMEVSPPTDTPLTPTRPIQRRSTRSSCGSTDQMSTLKDALKAREAEALNSTRMKGIMMSQMKQLEAQNKFLLSECDSERRNKTIQTANLEESMSRGNVINEYHKGVVAIIDSFVGSIVKRQQSVELEIETMKEIVSATDEAPELRRELERQSFLQQTLQQQLVKESTQREKLESLLRSAKREISEPREGSPSSLQLSLTSLEEHNESLKSQLEKALSNLSTARAERDAYLAANTSKKDARQLRETDVSFAVIRADLSKARDDARSKTQEIELLRKQLQRYQNQLGSPEPLELQLQSELKTLSITSSNEIQHLESKIKALTHERNIISQAREDLEVSSQTSASQIHQLESRLKTISYENNNLLTTVNNSNTDLLEEKISELVGEKKILLNHLSEYKNRLCDKETLTVEVEEQKQIAKSRTNQITELTLQLESLNEKYENCQQQILTNSTTAENEIEKLRGQLSHSENCFIKATSSITTLEQQLSQQDNVHNSLQSKTALLTEVQEELLRTHDREAELFRESNEHKDIIEELQYELEMLQKQVDQHKNDNNQNSDTKAALQLKIREVNEQKDVISHLEQQLSQSGDQSELEKELTTQLTENRRELKKSLADVCEKSREVKDLRQKVSNLETQNATVKSTDDVRIMQGSGSSASELLRQIEVLQQYKAASESREISLKNKLSDQNNSQQESEIISDLREERDYLRDEVDVLSQQVAVSSKQLQSLQRYKHETESGELNKSESESILLINDLQEERDYLRNEVDALSQQAATSSRQLQIYKQEVESRQSSSKKDKHSELIINDLKEERRDLRSELDAISKQLEILQQETNRNTVADLQEERDYLRSEVSLLEQQKHESDIREAALKSEMQDAKCLKTSKIITELKEEREYLRSEVDALEAHKKESERSSSILITELEEKHSNSTNLIAGERDSLQKQLKSLKAELLTLNNTHQQQQEQQHQQHDEKQLPSDNSISFEEPTGKMSDTETDPDCIDLPLQKEQIAHLEEERIYLRQEIDHLVKQLQNKPENESAEIEELKEERSYLRHEVDELTGQLLASSSNPDDVAAEMSELREERKYLRQEVDHLTQQLHSERELSGDSDLKQDREFLRREVASLTQKLQSIDSSNNSISEITKERDTLKQQLDDLNTDNTIAAERDCLQVELDSLTHQMKQQNTNHLKEQDFLTKELEDLTRQLKPQDDLNRQLEDLNIELTTITKREKADKKELESVHSERRQLLADLESSKQQQEVLQIELDDAKQLIDSQLKNHQVDELQSQLSNLQSEILSVTEERDSIRTELENTTHENPDLRHQIESMEAMHSTTKSQQESEISELTQHLTSTKLGLKNMTSECENFKIQVTNLQTALDEETLHTEGLEYEINHLQLELHQQLQNGSHQHNPSVKEADDLRSALEESNHRVDTLQCEIDQLKLKLQSDNVDEQHELQIAIEERDCLKEELFDVQKECDLLHNKIDNNNESKVIQLQDLLNTQTKANETLKASHESLTIQVAKGELAVEEKECLQCEISDMDKTTKRIKEELQMVKRDNDKLERILQSERLQRTPQKSASLLRERDDLLRDVKDLTRQLEKAETYIQEETRSIKDERDYLAAEVSSLKDLLPTHSSESKSEILQLNEIIKTNQREILDLQTERKWIKQEKSDLKNRFNTQTDEVEKLQSHVQQITDIHNKSMEGVVNQNKTLSSEADDLRLQLSRIKEIHNAENNTETASLHEQVNELRTDCRMLEKELTTEKSKSADLKQVISQNDLSEYQTQLSELQSNKNALNQQNEQLQNNISVLTRDSQQHIARLRSDCRKLQTALDSENETNNQLHQQLEAVTNNTDKQDEIERLEEDVYNMQTQLKKLANERENEVTHLESQNKIISSQLEALQIKQQNNESDYSDEAEDLRTDLRNLKKVIKQRDSEMRLLQQSIKDQDCLQKKLKSYEKERQHTITELQTIRCQHEEGKMELETVQKERDDVVEELKSLRSAENSLLETSELTIKEKETAPRRQLEYQLLHNSDFNYSTGDLEGLLSERSPDTIADDFQSTDDCSLSSIGEPISLSTKRLLRAAEEAISTERSRNRQLNARVREKDLIMTQQSRQIKTLKSRMQVLSSALTSDIHDTPPTTPVGGSFITPRGVSGSVGSDVADDASLSSLPSSASALRQEGRSTIPQQITEKLHNTRSFTSSSSRKSKSPSATSRGGGESFQSVMTHVSDLSKKHLREKTDDEVPKYLRSRSAKAAWRQGGV